MSRIRTRIGAGAGLLALAAGGLFLTLTPLRPAAVIPGHVYRSRQPSGDELCRLERTIGLRSVVNLRGAQPSAAWYLDEVDAAERCGIGRLDVRFWTADWPPRAEVLRLVDYLDSAPRPLLLHCHSGVDRSSWAAAVARILEGHSYPDAVSELDRSERLGVPAYGARFFDLYDRWLAVNGRRHDGTAFRDWVRRHYYPPPFAAELELLSDPPPAEVTPGARIAVRVRATNRSSAAWRLSSRAGHGIRLGASLAGPFADRPADVAQRFRRRGRPGVADVARAATPDAVVAPGESREFALSFEAPSSSGRYVVLLDMVEEQVHWFNEIGGDPLLLDVRVRTAVETLAWHESRPSGG